jgi:hypothetical protein
MGRGRGKPAIACALGALALALAVAGCGAQEHVNDPRPPIPTEITVSISDKSVNVQPADVGIAGKNQQPTSQNEGQTNPEISSNHPLDVVFTIANLTDVDTHLEIEGPKDGTSPIVVSSGTAQYQISLPTGAYLVSAADIPSAVAAHLNVGPDRVSSQNDLLLP